MIGVINRMFELCGEDGIPGVNGGGEEVGLVKRRDGDGIEEVIEIGVGGERKVEGGVVAAIKMNRKWCGVI